MLIPQPIASITQLTILQINLEKRFQRCNVLLVDLVPAGEDGFWTVAVAYDTTTLILLATIVTGAVTAIIVVTTTTIAICVTAVGAIISIGVVSLTWMMMIVV